MGSTADGIRDVPSMAPFGTDWEAGLSRMRVNEFNTLEAVFSVACPISGSFTFRVRVRVRVGVRLRVRVWVRLRVIGLGL